MLIKFFKAIESFKKIVDTKKAIEKIRKLSGLSKTLEIFPSFFSKKKVYFCYNKFFFCMFFVNNIRKNVSTNAKKSSKLIPKSFSELA